jgi:hypothetical protein
MDQDNLHFNLTWMNSHMSPGAGRKPRPDPAQPIGTWLARVGGQHAAWDSLWPSLERQSALQAEVDRFSAQFNCGRTYVRETGPKQLTWFALTTAQAAKMRNLKVSLETFLTDCGWHFNGVTIRTQPAKAPRSNAPNPAGRPPKPPLNPEQLAHWIRLEQTLEPGPLRDAVTRLIVHQSRIG